MTARVVRQRTSRVRTTAARTAVALTAGLLLAGTAGPAQAAPAAGTALPRTNCGAPAAGARTDAAQAPSTAPVGKAAQKLSFKVASQLPIGLWSPATLTLRTPLDKGTVRLDVSSRGFSTDSVTVQRYEPGSHRWVDLNTKPGGGSWPTHGVFSFPLTARASAARPYTVALRLQDLDRPGTLTVAPSVKDGHGHTYRAPARTATATRPQVTVAGWQKGTVLTRGGAAHPFSVTVKNTTNRAYPALTAGWYAFGEAKGKALTTKDLVLQQYRAGQGWRTVPLQANGCDPGLGAVLKAGDRPLAPGRSAVLRLRLSVAATAPREVTNADSGIAVSTGDQSFYSRQLPFAIRARG
ncbi:hypothetical protein [Streptomyces orinoci]|uniref:Uncharacterized protein n=1 Tax=Streptomyces orinoci TaxID=67339 RepID=A0ABV3JR88_STRON|nr:hypothetical protein [Streptomyces orinoci]